MFWYSESGLYRGRKDIHTWNGGRQEQVLSKWTEIKGGHENSWFLNISLRVHIHVYVHMYVYVCLNMYMNMCMYFYMYVYIGVQLQAKILFTISGPKSQPNSSHGEKTSHPHQIWCIASELQTLNQGLRPIHAIFFMVHIPRQDISIRGLLVKEGRVS